jgi:hypothetical protein
MFEDGTCFRRSVADYQLACAAAAAAAAASAAAVVVLGWYLVQLYANIKLASDRVPWKTVNNIQNVWMTETRSR